MSSIQLIFFCTSICTKTNLRKIKVKLDLQTDAGVLSMVKKGISGGICHAIHQYMKANDKYMKD